MTRVIEFVFWLSVCWLGYVYLGYPAALWILSRFRTFRPTVSNDFLPKVSVLVSARNEQQDIGWKVAETLSWDYPRQQLEMLVASDASDDNTDAILQSVTDPRLQYLRLEQRQGKNEALNRLNQRATGDLLFFTDVNAHIEPDCLRKLVRYFADSRVGCVTGSECTIRESETHAATAGIRSAIGYESYVSSLESEMGSVLVCDGSIFCIRRELFHPLQPELANDLELPLEIGARGYAILFEPRALSYEKASLPSEELQRKRRICGQGALALWRLRGRVHGLRAWQFFSRKVMRWMGLIPMALIFICSIALMRIPFYGAALAVQVLGIALAWIGGSVVARNREGSWITALPYFFILANLGAFSGVIGALRGERFSVWQSASHSRGADHAVVAEARNGAKPALAEPETGVLAGSVARGPALKTEKYRS
ncbi:MAG: glycosyltransferase [Candidatus Acidiferrales bacterium]